MAGEMHLIFPAPDIEYLGIYNSGSHTYLVSPELTIEKFDDGAWYEIPLPEEADFDGKTAYVGPGGRYHQKIKNVFNKKIYKEDGKYRVVKVLEAKEKGEEGVVLAQVITISGKK